MEESVKSIINFDPDVEQKLKQFAEDNKKVVTFKDLMKKRDINK